jgi:hypothetical protein
MFNICANSFQYPLALKNRARKQAEPRFSLSQFPLAYARGSSIHMYKNTEHALSTFMQKNGGVN